MLIFTHMKIGHYCSTRAGKKAGCGFRLKRGAFVLGNVWPDISAQAGGHFFADTRDTYHTYVEQAKDGTLSDERRSFCLGAACHYLCDYFCLYHGKKPYCDRSILIHLFYEFRLHLHMAAHLALKSITGKHSLANPLASLYVMDISAEGELEKVLDAYAEAEDCPGTDILFALHVLSRIMSTVLGAEIFPAEEKVPVFSEIEEKGINGRIAA